VNALRSYHHFLFLSRDAAADPCGLSVEVLTLQFWEAHCRVKGLPPPLRLAIAGGKIVVPFGADPLFHQNYGGLGGFDQPVLPVIWAVEGAAAHLVFERRALVVTDDLFVVRGYALPHADSIINLQSGFSARTTPSSGFGNRIGLSLDVRVGLVLGLLQLARASDGACSCRPSISPSGGRAASRCSSTSASGLGLLRADVSGRRARRRRRRPRLLRLRRLPCSSATTRSTGSTSSTAAACARSTTAAASSWTRPA
jgi:hypothetical protein